MSDTGGTPDPKPSQQQPQWYDATMCGALGAIAAVWTFDLAPSTPLVGSLAWMFISAVFGLACGAAAYRWRRTRGQR